MIAHSIEANHILDLDREEMLRSNSSRNGINLFLRIFIFSIIILMQRNELILDFRIHIGYFCQYITNLIK